MMRRKVAIGKNDQGELGGQSEDSGALVLRRFSPALSKCEEEGDVLVIDYTILGGRQEDRQFFMTFNTSVWGFSEEVD